MELSQGFLSNSQVSQPSLARYSRASRISVDYEVATLIEMGYDDKLIEKVYNILHPRDLTEAINFMTKENGLYAHPFQSGTRKSSQLCIICNEPIQNHERHNILEEEDEDIDNGETPGEGGVVSENRNDNDDENDYFSSLLSSILSNSNQRKNLSSSQVRESSKQNNNILTEAKIEVEGDVVCRICDCELSQEEKTNNALNCGHFFCDDCWFEQLRQKITDNQVTEMTCANFQCKVKLTNDFIISHLRGDEKLKQKFEDFKEKASIISDPNKKFCPTSNCKSYLQKNSEDKFVACKNGHKWCYECLKEWHHGTTCEEIQDKDFQLWSKGKILKKCPQCKIYTEKNEGCNHMTCAECKYQWCWLCEGEYSYGHYGENGPCSGLQFRRINYLSELPKQDQAKRKKRKAFTNEQLLNYIGPEDRSYKTTLRGNRLVFKPEVNRRHQQVYYPTNFQIDDDKTVFLDNFFCEIGNEGNVYSCCLCLVVFFAILFPPLILYYKMYGMVANDAAIKNRCIRFIMNITGFFSGISLSICYFCYSLVLLNFFHFLVCVCSQDGHLFNDVTLREKVSRKEMKRIRRFVRRIYIEDENNQNNQNIQNNQNNQNNN